MDPTRPVTAVRWLGFSVRPPRTRVSYERNCTLPSVIIVSLIRARGRLMITARQTSAVSTGGLISFSTNAQAGWTYTCTCPRSVDCFGLVSYRFPVSFPMYIYIYNTRTEVYALYAADGDGLLLDVSNSRNQVQRWPSESVPVEFTSATRYSLSFRSSASTSSWPAVRTSSVRSAVVTFLPTGRKTVARAIKNACTAKSCVFRKVGSFRSIGFPVFYVVPKRLAKRQNIDVLAYWHLTFIIRPNPSVSFISHNTTFENKFNVKTVKCLNLTQTVFLSKATIKMTFLFVCWKYIICVTSNLTSTCIIMLVWVFFIVFLITVL